MHHNVYCGFNSNNVANGILLATRGLRHYMHNETFLEERKLLFKLLCSYQLDCIVSSVDWKRDYEPYP